jgi:hypothetical protein
MSVLVKHDVLSGLKALDTGERRAAFNTLNKQALALLAAVLEQLGPPFSKLDPSKAYRPSFTTRQAKDLAAEAYASLGIGGVEVVCGTYGDADEYDGQPYLYVRIDLQPATRWEGGLLHRNLDLAEKIRATCADEFGWEELYQKRNDDPTLESVHRLTFGRVLCIADGSWVEKDIGQSDTAEFIRAAAPLCFACSEDHLYHIRSRYVGLLKRMPPKMAESGKGKGFLLERRTVVESLAVAMCTRKLVLLAGISGSGKTQLACRLAAARGTPEVISATTSEASENPLANELFEALKEADVVADEADGWVRVLPSKLEPEVAIDAVMDDGIDDVSSEEQEDEARDAEDQEGEGDEDTASAEGDDSAAPDEEEELEDMPKSGSLSKASSWVLVPVRPDWQEAASLWGWREKNVFHGTPALRLVLDAWRAWTSSSRLRAERTPVGHVLVLDEMNLSRIEHYGSDLLSAMERPGDAIIRLHDAGAPLALAGAQGVSVPPLIGWAPGLSVVGTVNVDETTFAFAPKVLDRACVLEFLDVDLERTFRIREREAEWLALAPWMAAVQSALRPYSLHLGYRAAFEIADLAVAHLGKDPSKWNGDHVLAFNRFLDEMLRNKVLPRVRGSRAQIEPVLRDLLAIAMGGLESNARAAASEVVGKALDAGSARDLYANVGTGTYPEAALKCLTMLDRVDGTGFASFF